MTNFYILVSGIAGTLIMTLMMYLIGVITGKQMNGIRFLGMFLFSGRSKSSYGGIKWAFGTVLHFMAGIIYAFVFYGLWSIGIGKPNFFFSIVFGIVSGTIALFVWKSLFFLNNSHDLKVPERAFYISLFICHIFFSIAVFFTYLFIVRYPLPMDQSINCC